MQDFEKQYKNLIIKILLKGEDIKSRNGKVKYLFGEQIKFNVSYNNFPILQGRKIYYTGVIGEFCAFMNNAKTIEEYESYGCNYWKLWAKNGIIDVDYSEQLFVDNQLNDLISGLTNDPHSRRHIISLWNHGRLKEVALPCCHHTYQFYVDGNNLLHMIWMQRSVDTMVGLPSDMVLAGLWLTGLSKMLGYFPGTITMQLGHTHIYEEHIAGAFEYIQQLGNIQNATTKISFAPGFMNIIGTKPSDYIISDYTPCEPIKFKLKA